MKNAFVTGLLLATMAHGPFAFARMQPAPSQPPQGGAAGNAGANQPPAQQQPPLQAPPAGQQPAPPPAPPPQPPPAPPPAAGTPAPAAPSAPPGAPPAAPAQNPNVSPPVVLPPSSSPPTGSTGPIIAPSLRRKAGDLMRSTVRRGGTPATRGPGGRTVTGKPPGGAAGSATAAPTPEAPSGSTATTDPATGTITLQNTGSEAAGLPGEKEFNQCKKLPAGRRILKFNFKPDSEISDLVGWISTISCTQFLIAGPTLQGKKVTVLSPQLITPEEAYRLFLGALESVGLTVEPMGRFLRIVETGRARFSNLPIYRDGEPIHGDKRYVTRLFRFDHLESTDVLTNLYNQVRGEQGVGVAYQGSLIVTDQAVMIQRFEELVRELDLPSVIKEKIWMVRVKNTSATEMAGRLAEIFAVQQMGQGGRRQGGPGGPAPAAPPPPGQARPAALKRPDLASQLTITKLIPDERSNQLIVVANEQAYEWLLTIMKKLDVPIEGGGDGRFHIYYCEHANCDELAATLAAITGVAVFGGGARRTTRTSAPGQPAAPPPPSPGGAGQQQQLPQLFEGDVRVTFDAATNSLVVYSSLKDYQSLRRVIDKLDLPRKQIFVEAMIMEVLLDKTRTLGVAYHGGKQIGLPGTDQQATLLGGFNAGKTLSPAALAGDLVGLAGALFGPALDATATRIFGTNVDIPSFGAFVKILQENNDVNVLSTPHLLITNNQEGEISVGSRLPFPGALLGGGLGGLGGQGQAGLGFLPQVSVNREDVSLRMKLIPSVNEHNMIRLDVDVEISDLMSANFGGLVPATTKRTAKTPVFCKDQQTVVIGGLMSDRVTDTVQKIPVLGDIPVLGFFFRNTTKQVVKSNIIIALTPYVIDDMDDLRRVAEKKLRERREFIERFSSAEDKASFDGAIDYQKKRGMLEEINRSAREIDDEEAALRRIRERDLLDESTPIELPTVNQPPARRSSNPPQPRPGRPDDADDPGGKPQGAVPASARPSSVAAKRGQ